jgi:hypothetical protein
VGYNFLQKEYQLDTPLLAAGEIHQKFMEIQKLVFF